MAVRLMPRVARRAPYHPPALNPIEQLRAGHLPRRLVQLLTGLVLWGISMAMMIKSAIGVSPWDVLHQGIALHVPLSFGQIVIAVGAILLVIWVPLRQWPGVGTVLNVLVIGISADVALLLMSAPESLPAKVALMVGGVVVNGIGGALYIGTHLGPGPRDGLWLGLVSRTGWSVRLIRTIVEVTVVVVGFLLGGTLGIGTVVYALAIGPIVQFFLPLASVRLDAAGPSGEDPTPV